MLYSKYTYCVSIIELELLSILLFGLKVPAVQVGGAALFNSLAHVAIFVFICVARRKCLPI